MKYLLLLVLLTSTVSAKEYELGVGYSLVNINWIADSKFKPNLLTVEGTAWITDYFGIRSQYGKSDEVANLSESSVYSNSQATIDTYLSAQAVLRKELTDNLYIEVSGGEGSYIQAVTHFYEKNYSNRDAGWIWGIGMTYYLDRDWSVRVSYLHHHDKTKTQEETHHFLDGDGHESTESYGITLTFKL